MNVRLFPGGPVHGAGKMATTCGMTKLFAREWAETLDPVTCPSCVRRAEDDLEKRRAERADALTGQLDALL